MSAIPGTRNDTARLLLAAREGTPTEAPAPVRTEAVGVLAAGLAHDLNSMLGGIMATAELVADRMPPGSMEARDLEAIVAQAGRAGDLVRQILAFSRQEMLSPENFDLADMVRAMKPVLRAVTGQWIALDTPSMSTALVFADRGAMERVLLNLIRNATEAIIRSGERAGRLTVTTGFVRAGALPPSAPFMERRDYATISVADDGPGVPPSIAARIFEPYFSTKDSGRGLGLASAFGIVKQSGGYMLLDKGPLGGACFTCYLPHRISAPVRQRCSAGSRRLLLAEDEPLLRASLARGLEVAGYIVSTAVDGEEAAEMFMRDDGFDLLLTDMRMPGLDGLELSRRLRRRAPRLPVLFMSGFTDERSRADVTARSAFVTKPVKLKILTEEIERLIAS